MKLNKTKNLNSSKIIKKNSTYYMVEGKRLNVFCHMASMASNGMDESSSNTSSHPKW